MYFCMYVYICLYKFINNLPFSILQKKESNSPGNLASLIFFFLKLSVNSLSRYSAPDLPNWVREWYRNGASSFTFWEKSTAHWNSRIISWLESMKSESTSILFNFQIIFFQYYATERFAVSKIYEFCIKCVCLCENLAALSPRQTDRQTEVGVLLEL